MRKGVKLIIVWMLLSACEESDGNYLPGIPEQLPSVKVDVFYLDSLFDLNPLNGSLVELYSERSDFKGRIDAFRSGRTDTTGHKTFTNIPSGYYWVTVNDSSWGEESDSVSVTSATVVSFVEIIYF